MWNVTRNYTHTIPKEFEDIIVRAKRNAIMFTIDGAWNRPFLLT